MKKISIFLGLSLLILAMGSAVAVKALVVVAPDYIRYPTSNLPNPSYACVEFVPTICTQPVGNICTESAFNPYTSANGSYRVYESKIQGVCTTELFRAVF